MLLCLFILDYNVRKFWNFLSINFISISFVKNWTLLLHIPKPALWHWQRRLILLNNQLYTQFSMYVYLYSLHVSGNHVPIIRRNIVSVRHLVYVTLCRWPSGTQVSFIQTCIPDQFPFLQTVLTCAFDKCTLIVIRLVINIIWFFFRSSIVHLDIITSFICPTECTIRLL